MIGCFLIHGFTGSPKELEPLSLYLEQQGFRVYAPVLAGHDGSRDGFKRSKWTDWVHSAEEALCSFMKEHPHVLLIGFSMGGLIAAHLATKYSVEKLVLLSPAMFTPNFQQIMEDIREGFRNKDEWLIRRMKWYLQKVMVTPIRPIIQFRKLVRNLGKDIPRVKIPTLIIHGHRDEVVHPRSAKYIYDSIASPEKRLYYLPNSRHIVCHDQEQDRVKELVISFLSPLQKNDFKMV